MNAQCWQVRNGKGEMASQPTHDGVTFLELPFVLLVTPARHCRTLLLHVTFLQR